MLNPEKRSDGVKILIVLRFQIDIEFHRMTLLMQDFFFLVKQHFTCRTEIHMDYRPEHELMFHNSRW